jgi:hypothetical protein
MFLQIIISFIFIVFVLKLNTANAYICHEDEINFDHWCYKLTNTTLINDLDSCEILSFNTSSSYVTCLTEILSKIVRIYTSAQSSFIANNYEFVFLDVTKNDPILRKLINLHATNQRQLNNFSLNVFFNYYSYNYHGYIESQPQNDQIPNLMMHPDEDDLKNLSQVCIIGQQVANNNESFKFKYSECGRSYPFICVKPLKRREGTEHGVNNNRCDGFRENLPGGNWIDCDRMLLNDLLSESQMCCMYNVNLNENFDDANRFFILVYNI